MSASGAAGLKSPAGPRMLASCLAQGIPYPTHRPSDMAWVDDRIYAHPKVLTVSKQARWSYIAGISYSSGWGTQGVLNGGALLAIGCTRRERDDLVAAGLWIPDGDVLRIKDWDEHNAQRDERRRKDRERKRRWRASAGQDADATRTNVVTLHGTARVEGSEGSDE